MVSSRPQTSASTCLPLMQNYLAGRPANPRAPSLRAPWQIAHRRGQLKFWVAPGVRFAIQDRQRIGSHVTRKLTRVAGNEQRDPYQMTLDALRSNVRSAEGALSSGEGLRRRQSSTSVGQQSAALARLPDHVRGLVTERQPRRGLNDLVLSPDVRSEVEEFLVEFGRASLLRSHSLEPRHKLLLIGPPGNGKTSLAEALAFEAGLMFLTVRYDALLNSYLGETAMRLRRLMDYASTAPCLLFFDEFEAVGKERGDAQDVGEMKRVIGSLLVHLDAVPSHVMVVCATNHAELLDRAVWRRFDLKVAIDPPGRAELDEWFTRLKASLGQEAESERDAFVELLNGTSFSQIESFTLDVRRKLVLSEGRLTPTAALRQGIDRWMVRLRIEQRLGQPNGGLSDRASGSGAVRRNKNSRKP